jgi:purine-binding chemotaxis protein CheW
MPEVAASREREEVGRILEERARALAKPIGSAEDDRVVEFVVLMLGSERYGVDLRRVLGTQTLGNLARIPGIPEFWAGIVNVRGTLYPVLDLRRHLGVTEGEDADASKKLVLVSGAGISVGLMVDDAPAVDRIAVDEIGPSLPGGSDAARRAVSGLTRDLLAVLDVDAVLADPRLTITEGSK